MEKSLILLCGICKQDKPANNFNKKAGRPKGRDSRCKSCVSTYFRERRRNKKKVGLCGCGQVPEIGYSVCKACLAKRYLYNRKLKQDAIDAYGGQCKCGCGCLIKDYEFLTIDHKNGGGTKHRKETGGGYHFYRWLRKNGYPEGFRVLCWNCNCSHGIYGYCPRSSSISCLA